MKTFNNIKQLRWERGISLRDLASASGVSYTTISKIENGDTTPTQITMMKISQGLKMKTENVFNLDWENNNV